MFILGSIARYTRWAAFETADASLWAEVREQVEEFLTAVHQRGGLAGERTRDAFYVKCDADNTTRSTGPGNRLEISVGLALEHPKHYLSFHICNSSREVTVEELGWPPCLALAG